jgi:hypothetical protein
MYTQEAPKADGIVILTLNIGDSAQTLTPFMQSNGYDFPVLLNGSSAAVDYGVSGVPMTFFISRSGNIQYIKLGAFSNLAEFQIGIDKII